MNNLASNVITLDGPSGAGKGTISQLIAEALDYSLLDSGALYRITALAALKADIALDDDLRIAELPGTLKIEFLILDQRVRVMLNGEDVSDQIREEHVGMAASKVAANTALREALLDRQRQFADSSLGLVADGRDMGTVVFPNATCKFYLTASAEERARRRVKQLEERGAHSVSYELTLSDIQERDDRDMNRKTAPLRPAEDAIMLDSTSMGIEEVFAQAMQEIRKRIV
ncbi:MAG: cytidylate kinase [Flavobacteriales bacterium]|jgi:cytidylate kinase